MIKSGVFFSEYEIEREIGRGSFGSVLQIRRRSTGEVSLFFVWILLL